MNYTAVIVTKNSGKILEKVINSVLKQTVAPIEFIFIDNNSSDGTIELLLDYKKKNSTFRIFTSKIDVGVCKEINLAVNMTKSSTVIIMDDDAILVNENWIELAIKKLKNNIAVVWGNPSGILNKKSYGEFFLGCAFLVSKEIFQKIGGYDEKFFLYENDTDLTVRIHRNGYRVLPLKSLKVIHPYGPKSRRYYEFALANRILIYWKYYPYWVSILMTILHLFQELKEIKDFRWVKYWLKGVKRLFNNLYSIGLSYPNHMGLKEFFRSAYQLCFPAFGSKLVKFLYGI